MTARLGYVPQLDGLRAVAIGLVLLHHLPAVIGRDLGPLQPFAAAGWIGVDVFFALSGFLITSILLPTVGQPGYWRQFYVRRALRILPLYYAVLTFIFVPRLLAQAPPETLPSPWWFYAFVSNFWYAAGPGSSDLVLEVTWSLSVEEQFYLVWPLLVKVLPRRGLAVVLIAIVAIGPLTRIAWAHDAQTLCYTACRMDGIAYGCLAALAWQRQAPPRPKLPGWIAGSLWIGILLAIWLGAFQEQGWGIPSVSYALVPLATVSTIFAALSSATGHLSTLLRQPALVRIGRISFGLYLIHPLCFSAVRQLCSRWGWTGPHVHPLWLIATAALATGLSIAMAEGSFRLFEQRFLNFKARLAPASAGRARPAGAAMPQHL